MVFDRSTIPKDPRPVLRPTFRRQFPVDFRLTSLPAEPAFRSDLSGGYPPSRPPSPSFPFDVAGKVDHTPRADKSKPSLFFAIDGSVFAKRCRPANLGQMGASRDCEAVVHALLGQPVNSLTTAAFVLAGAIVVLRSDHTWVGIAAIATGVGSFLFHGPMPAYAEWVHDFTLAWLILIVASHGRSWGRWARLPGLAIVAAILAIPGTADPVAVALTALAIVLLVMRDRSWSTLGPLSLLVAVAIIGRLGATGGPLCSPNSVWQPHGLWHIGAATALAWWALATRGEKV